MKRLTALVLALLMALSLGSVALADYDPDVFENVFDWENISLDDAHIEIDMGYGFEEDEDESVIIVIAPGSKFYVDVLGLLKEYVDEEPPANAKMSQDTFDEVEALLKNFKCEYKVTKGAALVKDISYKNGKITFALKENYTIGEIKDLEFTVTLTAKKTIEFFKGNSNSIFTVEKGDIIKLIVDSKGIGILYDIAGYESQSNARTAETQYLLGGGIHLGVANAVVTLEGAEETDDADIKDITGWARNNIIYKVEEDEAGYVKFGGTTSLFQITANMNSKEKLFLHLVEDDKDIIDALTKNNTDATLHTYTLEGKVAFRNAAEFTVQADYADQYTIYTYNDGKLTKVDVEWDSIEGVYKWNVTEMTTYVISDVELVAADETDAEAKNPDTGANDVIGVAAALAVVSLAAAAALSRKK